MTGLLMELWRVPQIVQTLKMVIAIHNYNSRQHASLLTLFEKIKYTMVEEEELLYTMCISEQKPCLSI